MTMTSGRWPASVCAFHSRQVSAGECTSNAECVPGPAPGLDDGRADTVDFCEPASGVHHVVAPPLSPGVASSVFDSLVLPSDFFSGLVSPEDFPFDFSPVGDLSADVAFSPEDDLSPDRDRLSVA